MFPTMHHHHPSTLQADSINFDHVPIQPLPVELLLSEDQRRTSRNAPDETEAILSELNGIEAKKQPTL